MIVSLALYAVAVSLLLGGAACLVERVALARGWPTRWIWSCALAGSTLLPAAALVRRPAPATPVRVPVLARVVAAAPAGARAAVREALPPRVTAAVRPVVRARSWRSLGAAARASARALLPREARRVASALRARAGRAAGGFGVLWGSSVAVGLLVLGATAARLARRRRGWWETTVDGVDVLVSRDVGPAVVGALDGRIVLPWWVLDLAMEQRALILAHEREHVEAGDQRVTALATLAVLLAPWNPALWWQRRRLRDAVEMDCDARVLRGAPDVAAYGRLLLAVGARSVDRGFALAAFAERRSGIERRLVAMTAPRARERLWRAAVPLSLAGAIVAAACVAPRPSQRGARRTVASASAVRADSAAGWRSRVRVLEDSIRRLEALVAPVAVPAAEGRAVALRNATLIVRDSAGGRTVMSGDRLVIEGDSSGRATTVRALDDSSGGGATGSPEALKRAAALARVERAAALARGDVPPDAEAATFEGIGCGPEAGSGPRLIRILVDPRDAGRPGRVIVEGRRAASGARARLETADRGANCTIQDVQHTRLWGRRIADGATLTLETREPVEIRVETPDGAPVVAPFTVDGDTKSVTISWTGRARRP